MLNEVEIRKAISTLIGDGNLFECRIIGKSKLQPSGYFTDSNVLIEKLKRQDLTDANVYIVLNRLKKECSGRKQFNKFIGGATTTSDNDIKGREWILIDLDPDRPKDTSSTKSQVESARRKASQMYSYLKREGFPDPVVAFSGNGYHLLYKVQLVNDDENKRLVERFLKAMDALFSDDKCRASLTTDESDDELIKVDKAVFNASRICKLYGTVAQKGENTVEQPHRMSKILKIPDRIEAVDRAYIEKVAGSIVPDRVHASKYNNYNAADFDVEDWMSKHGLQYRPIQYSDGTKYILDHCPFDPTHKGKDAAIFKVYNGGLAFKCFHDSCSDKTWRDVRLLFEPDAYSKKWEEQKRIIYKPNAERIKELPKSKPIVEEENRPVFLTAQMILDKPMQEQTFVKTGIWEIDKRMRGLMKGQVSVWSGLRGSAKSTVLSQITLNAVDTGCKAIVYSGELNDKNFMRWMNQQAAGHATEPSAYEGYYNTPIAIQRKIAEWLGENFYLYDNAYGNDFVAVIDKIEEQITEINADLVILDNLMAFNISSLGYTKWDAQSAFVFRLHEMALKHNVHIAFVAHPKKAAGFLRFDDISGTADLGNAVDDAFIVHRNNEDFRRMSSEMFHWKDDNEVYDGTNVIEIVKDRDGGTQDVFIPLYYEARSKRLKNRLDENVVYGWEGDYVAPESIDDDEEWMVATEEEKLFV